MAETRARDWMEELLVRAAETVEYPPTPDIVAGVRPRLASGGQRFARPFPLPAGATWTRAAAAGLLVLGLATALALSVSSQARDAVADFLGLRVAGEEIAIMPTPQPDQTLTPPPPTRDIASYATPTPLESIEATIGFAPALPEGFGAPAEAYVVDYQGSKAAVLQYDRFDLWELRLADATVGKVIPFFTKESRVLEEMTVNEQPAYWLEGGGHIVRFVGRDGTVVAGSERTVERSTLIWRSVSGVNYRLETDLEQDEALQLAETLP